MNETIDQLRAALAAERARAERAEVDFVQASEACRDADIARRKAERSRDALQDELDARYKTCYSLIAQRDSERARADAYLRIITQLAPGLADPEFLRVTENMSWWNHPDTLGARTEAIAIARRLRKEKP